MAQDNTPDQKAVGGVDGAGIFSIKIDGEAPPPTGVSIQVCHIVENSASVPALLLVISDRNNLFRNDRALVDGTKIEITTGTSIELAKTYKFNVMNVKEGVGPDGAMTLDILALFDFPKFIFDVRSWSIKGNSQTAMQTLCTECDLEFDTTVVTNDDMKWTSVAQSPRQFIANIQSHAYLNDESYVATILDAEGKLICRDLNSQMRRKPQHKIAYNFDAPTGTIVAQECRLKSLSGVLNSAHNYGENLVWNSTDGNTNTLKTLTHIAQDPLNVNTEIRESLSAARKTYVPNTTDINYHANWVKAEYINKRFSATYTETCRILILGFEHDIQLYDTIDLSAGLLSESRDTQLDPKLSGSWIVVGRTRTFAENRFSVSYFLARNFTTVEGTTEVGGGQNEEPSIFETVAAFIRPYELNFNISQILGELSPIDALADMQEGLLKDLTDGFKEMSDKYGFTELYEKYGEGVDYLKALLQEFNLAQWLSGMCQALNMLEKLSINISIELGDTILQDLASRLDKMDSLGSVFTNQINDLIANGDIPAEYMSGPQINQRCVSNKIDDLNKSINDALPDKCLDAFSIGRLLGPSMNLAQLVRQTEEMLRNMLCALGDGTVDDSSDTGTPDGKQLDQYLPHGSWKLQR